MKDKEIKRQDGEKNLEKDWEKATKEEIVSWALSRLEIIHEKVGKAQDMLNQVDDLILDIRMILMKY